MMYPVHTNSTGSFQELVHASEVKFGQLSLLTIEPRCSRGGHYHARKEEWFCCTHGQCLLTTIDIRNGQRNTVTLNEANREFVYIKPYEAHLVLNSGDDECELLIISSEEYDPSDPDTIKCVVSELIRETVCSR